jgi:hypothetical protein
MIEQTTCVAVGVHLDVNGQELVDRLRKSLQGLQRRVLKAAWPMLLNHRMSGR